MKNLIKDWKKIYSDFESSDFDYFDDKKEIGDLFYEINDYMKVAIISTLSSTDKVAYYVSKLKEIFNIKEKHTHLISRESVNNIKNILEDLLSYLNNIEHLYFWVDLDRKNSLAIKNIEDSLIKTIQEEAKFSFGKATSRRIDYEFSEQYKEIKEKLESKEGCFMFILCFLFLGSFISVLVSLKMDIFDLFLSRLIIIAPIVWLLWYLNSQIKEDRRILQTYLHKKVIASSYMNYASTFNENTFIRDNEVKKEMITLLLKLSIETLKENPATLLSKEKQNINTQEIINKLVDKLPIK